MDNTQRPYTFVAYNSEWPKQFEQIADTWRSLLGETAISIEHIGSTSVPGMKAKPLIDVLITVTDIDELQRYTEQIVAAGYQRVSEYISPRSILYFVESDDGTKTQNIHVFEKDSDKIKDFITIRDYLRAHPDEANRYSKIKELNYLAHSSDYLAYREAKKDYLDELRVKAHNWN